MSDSDVHYVWLDPAEDILPSLSSWAPFKAVVVVQSEASSEWQKNVSEWLVKGGCLFMMAWGLDCQGWHDSVDWALLEEFDFQDIPADRDMLTTWHDDEPLKAVFFFAQEGAYHAHPGDLGHTVIVHISSDDGRDEMLRLYAEAGDPAYIPD